jgi:hypothetical protein
MTPRARSGLRRLGVVLLLTACRGGDAVPATDTPGGTATPRGAATPATATAAAWPTGLGELLLAATGAGRTAAILLPDTSADALARVRGAALTLTGPLGDVGQATVSATEKADDPECIEWPSARIERDSSSAMWTLAVTRGSASGVPFTPFDALGTADSSAVIVELRRLASALPGDTNATFRGLPITVRDAARAKLTDSVTTIVAEVSRRVGQEAQPLEERVAFIAERVGTDPTWRVRWHQRVDGLEETIEATHLVGVVALADRQHVLVLQRESARGLRFELFVRSVDGAWERRWTGAWSGC